MYYKSTSLQIAGNISVHKTSNPTLLSVKNEEDVLWQQCA